MSKAFEDLKVWQEAKNLAIVVYGLTDKYPSKERFAITNQTTRAVVSIVANIAEGSSRSSKKDLAHFLEISIGSAFELETLLLIGKERDYISVEEYIIVSKLLNKTIQLLFGFKRSLR